MTHCKKHGCALEPYDARNPDSTLVCGDCLCNADVHDWDGTPDYEVCLCKQCGCVIAEGLEECEDKETCELVTQEVAAAARRSLPRERL